jgi:hypothetical protein
MNGEIKRGKEIEKLCGGTYSTECSDIGSLLYHIEENTTSPALRRNLKNSRKYIGTLYDEDSDLVYGEVIKKNRNSMLHGESAAPAEVGVVLNMTSLLVWTEYFG